MTRLSCEVPRGEVERARWETESACRPKVSSRCASSAMPSAARVIVPSRPAAAVSMVESTGSSSSEARFGSAIAAMAASCGDVSQPLIVHG